MGKKIAGLGTKELGKPSEGQANSGKMLYLLGLGLRDEKDITLSGLEIVRKCSKVYMEAYTCLLSFGLSSTGHSTLEDTYGKSIIIYGKSIIIAGREAVEEKEDDILLEAQSSDVGPLWVIFTSANLFESN